jgi:hypothetical protein
MSISASTSSLNAIVRNGPGLTLFEDGKSVTSSSSSWNQGDLICFDTGSTTLRAVTATGDAATFAGIADNVVVSGQLASPYQGLTPVNGAQVSPGFVGPKYGVTARLVVNTGDALTPGCKMYLLNGGTCQQVTVTNPGDGNYIGIYVGVAVASAAAGQQVDVLIGSRYPSGTGSALNLG